MKMGLVAIQLCAIFCLITTNASVPSCELVETKYLHDCISLSRRWYIVRDEIMIKTCPSLQPGAVGYDSCMETVDKSATEQIISEVGKEDDENIVFRSAFVASPGIVNGKPRRLQYAEKKPWSFWNIFKFW